MVYYAFGKKFAEDNESFLGELQHYLSNAPAVSPITAKIVLREIYERSYGIHDHADARLSPLHLVKLHTKENVSEFSTLYSKMRRFAKLEMASKMQMNVVEFLSMPREFVDFHFRLYADINNQKLKEPDPLFNLDK